MFYSECKSSVARNSAEVTNAFGKGTIYEKTRKCWKDITDAVTLYLVKDVIPIKMVISRVLSDF